MVGKRLGIAPLARVGIVDWTFSDDSKMKAEKYIEAVLRMIEDVHKDSQQGKAVASFSTVIATRSFDDFMEKRLRKLTPTSTCFVLGKSLICLSTVQLRFSWS